MYRRYLAITFITHTQRDGVIQIQLVVLVVCCDNLAVKYVMAVKKFFYIKEREWTEDVSKQDFDKEELTGS